MTNQAFIGHICPKTVKRLVKSAQVKLYFEFLSLRVFAVQFNHYGDFSVLYFFITAFFDNYAIINMLIYDDYAYIFTFMLICYYVYAIILMLIYDYYAYALIFMVIYNDYAFYAF